MKVLFKNLLIFFLIPAIGHAQLDSAKITVADIITFHSKILNEERKIYIYAPPTDTSYVTQSSPVLYLMDADEQMAMVTGQVIYLSQSFTLIPPMIIVGIGNIDRTKDLTPTHSTSGHHGKSDTSLASTLTTSGGGEKFLQFLREELMPYVEKHYKTVPFKTFCGHSLGALMAVYTLLKHPDMFNAYIAISPSLWWDEQSVLKQAKTWKPDFGSKKFLFFSDGSEGVQFHKNALTLDSLLKIKNTAELKVRYTYYPGETHQAEPIKATYDALRYIYHPVYPPEFDTLSDFIYFKPGLITGYYKNLSIRNGYEVKPPEAVLDRLAHYLLSLNNSESNKDALELLKINANNYPTSWHVYKSLGEIYSKEPDKKQAISNYKKALTLKPGDDKIKKKIQALESE